MKNEEPIIQFENKLNQHVATPDLFEQRRELKHVFSRSYFCFIQNLESERTWAENKATFILLSFQLANNTFIKAKFKHNHSTTTIIIIIVKHCEK
jgi:hypothetical protein